MAPALVLGPMLRWVGERQATVWVEVDRPCAVTVLGSSARTVRVHDRHYALVVVDGLEPGTETAYDVHLDEALVWPESDSLMPPSVIRTTGTSGAFRLSFGSCRLTLRPEDVKRRFHGACALQALGESGRRDHADLPELLFLAGDQVYADEVTDEIRSVVRHERPGPRPPQTEIADYEEYSRLYGVAWSEPSVRWLFSTVPTVMIFDDHDVHDDWNTSAAWREQMRGLPWWHTRVVSALASYWIYQHLGNLSPEVLATDDLWCAVQSHGGDAGALVDRFAEQVDAHPELNRWSYVRDVGRVRLLVIDTRCGRVLTEGRRAIADATEWDWCAEQARADIDHLFVGSSLPVLLPRPISDMEGWSEALTGGAWGPGGQRLGEKIRQTFDFEHWAAFRHSFVALTELLTQLAARADGPATVAVLSGDVHYSYLARGQRGPGAPPIWQVVASPIRNPLGALLRYINVVGFWRPISWVARWLARRAQVVDPELSWRVEKGPWFDNALATLTVEGRTTSVRWQKAVDDGGRLSLVELGRAVLTGESGPNAAATRTRRRRVGPGPAAAARAVLRRLATTAGRRQ